MDLAAAEPGKPSAMVAKIENLRPVKGTARAVLSGLPQGVGSPPLDFTADQTEITFPLEIAGDVRTGKHGGLFCAVNVPESGGMVLHPSAADGVLRIDPPAKSPDIPAAAKAGEKPAAAKPLSRLEQLRQKK